MPRPRPHYVVCNADESEPGTFKDRVVMEQDPFAVIEALAIAGFTTAATTGYIYVRGEYPLATRRLRHAIDQARDWGLLGRDIMGLGVEFDLDLRRGAGAYICGEETALFNSLEGFRGEPRSKPPYPTEAGLFGKPTAVNNVETLINLLPIVLGGGRAYAARGTEQSTGPKLFCLSGAVAKPGVYEVQFGTTSARAPGSGRRHHRRRTARHPARRRGRQLRRPGAPRPAAHLRGHPRRRHHARLRRW